MLLLVSILQRTEYEIFVCLFHLTKMCINRIAIRVLPLELDGALLGGDVVDSPINTAVPAGDKYIESTISQISLYLCFHHLYTYI
jgi:hypothetical protein